MFQDNRYIQEVRDNMDYLRNTMPAIEYLNDKISDLISIRASLLSDIRSTTVDAGYFALSSVRQQAQTILSEEAEKALRNTKEFDIPELSDGLFYAIRDRDTFDYLVNESTGALTVYINLDATAGTLRQYANAIEDTREDLGLKRVGNPAMASKMWKEKYYKPAREGTSIPIPKRKDGKKSNRKIDVSKYIAKYWKTIKYRRSKFGSRAPWWRILNYGTTPLASDRGGTAYPKVRATRFVERAKKRLKEIYNESYQNSNEIIKSLREQIISINRAILFCERLLGRIQSRIYETTSRTRRPSTAEVREFALDAVRRQAGDRFGLADYDRILILIDLLIADAEIETEKFTLSARKGEEVRVRYVNLRREIQEFRNRTI